MLNRIFLISLLLLCKTTGIGQCPESNFLWNRVVYLRDSSDVPASEQIKELSIYLNKINNCSYQNDSTAALLFMRLGWLLSAQKYFKRSIDLTNKTIQIVHSKQKISENNEALLINAYNNLSIFYDSMGQEKLKLRCMDSCISISVRLKTGYEFSIGHIYNEMAFNFAKGDYYNCLTYANIGEEISGKFGYQPEDILYFTCWKINALIFLDKYDEAERLADNSIIACRKSGSTKYIGTLYGLRANIAEERGDSDKSIWYTNQSFQFNKKIKNYTACFSVLNNLGYKLYFKKLHDEKKALQYYSLALAYATINDSLISLNNIANLYVDKENFDSASKYFQLAFDKLHPGTSESFLSGKAGDQALETIDAEYVINLVLDKADAFLKKYKKIGETQYLHDALLNYKAAEKIMDKIKIRQTDLSSKLFWRTDIRRLYERAIESCYLSGKSEDAFYFFEKSRAVLLNDQLQEQSTADSNLAEMALIKRKILKIENHINSLNPSLKETSDLQRELFINREQLARLDQIVRENNPWYYQNMIDTNFISAKVVQNKLLGNKGSQAILEFFIGDSAVYLLTITADKSKISRIDKKDFETNVDKYTAYLSSPDMENQDYAGFISTGQQLNHLIFNESVLPEGRIIISPDGKYFPLEALVMNNNVSAPEYFLDKHIVSYTYSVRFLLNDFTKNNTSTTQDFMGIAPVKYSVGFNLAPLSESDASLEKISSRFGNPKIFVASQASKTNFMNQFYGYKIIQLYTHASDSGSNGEPVIYFADSVLSLSELIPENKPAAQLIVLSACETGNGKLYKGEGVFSFNRGFAALGIPSSVINLWSVENESTYRITELFYKYVAEGLPLDIALQRAKLDFINSSSKGKKLPYYWAAAILAGKTDAVELSTGVDWKWLLITAVIILAILVFFLTKRKGKPAVS